MSKPAFLISYIFGHVANLEMTKLHCLKHKYSVNKHIAKKVVKKLKQGHLVVLQPDVSISNHGEKIFYNSHDKWFVLKICANNKVKWVKCKNNSKHTNSKKKRTYKIDKVVSYAI